jgi:hypothetical protein
LTVGFKKDGWLRSDLGAHRKKKKMAGGGGDDGRTSMVAALQ